MTKHGLLVALGLLAASFALPASAQLDRSAFYLGGSLGRSHFTDLCVNAMPECKDRDTEWSMFGGMQFNPYFGAEIGYRDFGHGTRNTFDYKANASEIDLVASYPMRGGLGLIGRLGLYHGKLKGGGAEERKSNATFGWGVFYDFTPTAGMRFEYQRYMNAGGGDLGFQTHIDSVSLGAVLRFR